MKKEKRKHYIVSRIVANKESYLIAKSGIGSTFKEASWTPDPAQATKSPSKYSAKMLREANGFSFDCPIKEI